MIVKTRLKITAKGNSESLQFYHCVIGHYKQNMSILIVQLLIHFLITLSHNISISGKKKVIKDGNVLEFCCSR